MMLLGPVRKKPEEALRGLGLFFFPHPGILLGFREYLPNSWNIQAPIENFRARK